MSDVVVRPVMLGMVLLRGAPGVLGPALTAAGMPDLPARRMSAKTDAVTVLWLSPDEAMVICPPGESATTAARLTEAIGDGFGTVLDLSAARQIFDLSGQRVRTVLSGLMPVDFDRLEATEVRRTRMAQIPVALWRHDDGWRLMCFRSVAGYASDLLRIGAGLEAEAAGA